MIVIQIRTAIIWLGARQRRCGGVLERWHTASVDAPQRRHSHKLFSSVVWRAAGLLELNDWRRC